MTRRRKSRRNTHGQLRTPTSVADAKAGLRRAKKHRARAVAARKDAAASGYQLGVAMQDDIISGYDAAIDHFTRWLSAHEIKRNTMKRTSRRSKRTSRRNETVASSLRFVASRKKKIEKLGRALSLGLHKMRQAGGPPLTIEEERRLDSIALDAAQTREQISGPHNRHEVGLQKRVAKALGYNY